MIQRLKYQANKNIYTELCKFSYVNKMRKRKPRAKRSLRAGLKMFARLWDCVCGSRTDGRAGALMRTRP